MPDYPFLLLSPYCKNSQISIAGTISVIVVLATLLKQRGLTSAIGIGPCYQTSRAVRDSHGKGSDCALTFPANWHQIDRRLPPRAFRAEGEALSRWLSKALRRTVRIRHQSRACSFRRVQGDAKEVRRGRRVLHEIRTAERHENCDRRRKRKVVILRLNEKY